MHSDAKERIATSAGRVSFGTIISRLLGIARDSVFAAYFGTSYVADAFNLAFSIPNLLRRIFGEGMLNASYVPVYSQYLHRDGKQAASDLANKTYSVMLIILGVVSILGAVFSGFVVKAFAYGWRNSPESFALTVKLTRVLFPYLAFVGLASLASGTLNSLGHFAVPAFAPSMLNIALIGTAFTFMRLGQGSSESMITLFSYGALLGGLFQILIQVPQLVRAGQKFKFDPDFKDAGVRWIGRLMVPSMFSFAVTQINVLVDTLLATFLPEGSVTALRLGNRIAIQPLGIFAIAITTATLPALSEHAAKENRERLLHDFAFSLKLILAFLIPSTIGLMVLAKPLVRVLFERGEFTAARSTPMTVSAIMFYTIGLFAYGGVKSTVQAFYSVKDTMTPMKVSIFSMLLNVVLNLILMRPLKLGGLALATSISAIVAFWMLNVLLKRKLGDIREREIWVSAIKLIVASLVMGGVMYVIAHRLEPRAVGLWWELFQVAAASAVGLAAFLAVSLALKAEEVIFLLRLIARKLGLDGRPKAGSQA
ncbi:MAG TPA: murein biosynthesis integral membrane protein MurJ [bacterium]|nr:murein biosynthesis integral membrane protein MurJ [bacterium]